MEQLRLENVVYQYRNKYQTVTAVNHASYGFEAEKLYAIAGKSGSGKTTLLSLMAGLDLPGEGRVVVNGAATSECNRDLLRRDQVSVIYQNYNLFPLLTVEENVVYPLRLKKQSKEQAREVAREKLLAVGLQESQFRRLPNMLSGGEQQRVAIARALATGSTIILADEPTGNLDTGNTQNIVEILCRLAHEEGRCVIVVTHDPSVACHADVKLRMTDGTLEEDEPA